jgi:hypothetical protein
MAASSKRRARNGGLETAGSHELKKRFDIESLYKYRLPLETAMQCPCNNCPAVLEFDEAQVGQTVQCSSCGMDTILFLPHLSQIAPPVNDLVPPPSEQKVVVPDQITYERPRAPEQPEMRRRKATARAGEICCVLGLGFIVLSPAWFFVFAPLLLLAFILGIIAVAQGHLRSGIGTLLATLILAPLLLVGRMAIAFHEADQVIGRERDSAAAECKIEDARGYVEGSFMYLKGRVRNDGQDPVKFVKVEVEWLAKDNTVIDTDSTYAVGSDELRPGGAKSFEIMTPANRSMAKYRYWVSSAHK